MSERATRFWNAVQSGDHSAIRNLLATDSSLAGRNFEPDSLHTDGFPLVQATRRGDFEQVRMLLAAGADPDAKLKVDDPRESGMPLMNALEMERFDIVNLILDHRPNLNAFPYCSTPFVDCLFNGMWDTSFDYRPGEAWRYQEDAGDVVKQLFWNAYRNYLDDLTLEDSANVATSDSFDFLSERLQLLKRVVSMGGQPSLFTLVRHEQHELIRQLLTDCSQKPGTPMDWPTGSVFDNICYGASWCGYPKTLQDCVAICPMLYTAEVAKRSIERAIRSHNRDGDIDQYFELIQHQIEFLDENQKGDPSFLDDPSFLPLHWLADDFIEPSHYGFKCTRLGTQADIIRLTKLLVIHGFDINHVDPVSKQTPIQIARRKNLSELAEYFLQCGAVE